MNDKREILFKYKVPYYWIADPIRKAITVFRWTTEGYVIESSVSVEDGKTRLQPFAALEFDASLIFADLT